MAKKLYKSLAELPVSYVAEVQLMMSPAKKIDFEGYTTECKKICSNDIVAFFRKKMANHIDHHECMYALLLNRGNKPIGVYKVSQGGIAGTYADLKMILQAALLTNSSAVVLAHNHPSGYATPSSQDKLLTKRVKAAIEVMDMVLLDHVVICEESYYSFADEDII